MKNSKEQEKDKAKRKVALQKKYGQRITIARQGRDAFLQKDYVTAQRKYNEYLSILAQLNGTEDIFTLSPTMFDGKREVTEMLLVSHIYWEIARINETAPQLHKIYVSALSQFIKFTINQPFQVLNAEMLRKYIKKNKKVSTKISTLNEAYQQIFVQSKKCYIASHALGFDSPETNILRHFKLYLIDMPGGLSIVRIYYKLSPHLVNFLQDHPKLDALLSPLMTTCLKVFARFFKSCILK